MPPKININTIIERLDEYGLKMIGDYIDTKTPVHCIDSDGFHVDVTIGNLKRNKPIIFSVHNPHTINNIRLWIKNDNRDYILISDKYISANSKLKWKCLKHSIIWEMSWTDIQRHIGCYRCNGLLFPKYPPTINDVKSRLKIVNKNIKILDEEYICSKTKLNCVCLICNHHWLQTFNNLNNGSGCPKCNRDTPNNAFGTYNIVIANRNKDVWKNKNAIVYTIKCTGNNEEFYKVGITTSSVKNRFSGCTNMPYEYIIIKQEKTNLYDAIILESKLHEIHKEYQYTPQLYFGGYTECYNKINYLD